MSISLIAMAAALLVAGAALTLITPPKRLQIAITLASQALATMFVLWAVVPLLLGGAPIHDVIAWAPPFEHITVHIDALSAMFLTFSMPMTLIGTIYATGYLRKAIDGDRHVASHFALLSAVQLSYIIIYASESSLFYLLGWELAAFSAWLLVIFEHHEQKIRFAGFNYLVSTHVGLLFLVAGVMLIYARTHSLDFSDFTTFYGEPSTMRSVVFVLLLISFGLKSAFFPFHSWLPRAHAAAPAHVSALMSGVIHKAGLFGFLRFTLLMGAPEAWMGWLALTFGATSAVTGVLYSATQRDMKRLLGYSSTENVGIAMMGFGVGYLGLSYHIPALAALGFAGGLLHVINHALFKCLLFYGAGAVYRQAHTIDIERLGGVAKRMPRTAFAFFIGSLAICALPPLNGFVSEFLIYSALFSGQGSVLVNAALGLFAAALAFVGAVSALSTVRCYGLSFLGVPRDPRTEAHGEASAPIQIAMGAHVVGVVAIALCPLLGAWVVCGPVAMFSPQASATIYGSLLTLTQIHLGLAGVIGLVWVARRLALPGVAAVESTWGCGYTAPNARMQYSASSFSDPLLSRFATLLPKQQSFQEPNGLFPRGGSVKTNYFDAVERRILQAVAIIERIALQLAARTPDSNRLAFTAGALTLIAVVAWVIYSIKVGL
jgi:hydrogenase-4 component B